MWDTIHDLVEALWPLLPELTIIMRFCTALIGLTLAAGGIVGRYRRRRKNQLP
jgi:hypothetical protein